MSKSTNTKYDWSTPYDEWLIPILNEYRYSGAIKCRSIPSVIQIHIEKELAKDRQQLLQRFKEEVPEEENYLSAGGSTQEEIDAYNKAIRNVHQILETMESKS